MKERVTSIDGELPIVVVVPHGPSNPGLIEFAEIVAKEIDAYAIINRG
jgi:hypothetical protein